MKDPSPRIAILATDWAIAPRFVQHRLALFGKVVFAFGVTYLAMAVVLYLRGVEPLLAPGRESHVAAVLIALAVWQVAQRPRALDSRLLGLIDIGGTLGVCVCLVIMGQRYAKPPIGSFAGTISVFHVVLARALIVPSSPSRTLLVTAFSFMALVVSQQIAFEPDPSFPIMSSRWVAMVLPSTLSGTGTALATLASKVIYGLHEEVRAARQLGQYTLEEKIGEGGMGEVYRAHHAMLRRPTAIKLLPRDVSERELHRFEKEVQLTAQLTHPNTISIYDYGRTPDGTFYYAMELLDGVTLEALVAQHGAQASGRVIHILMQICAALREAHGAGLIHRDIKPDNVFLCRQGGLPDVVKVLDFGLVKQVVDDTSPSRSNVDRIVGTPLYMSPEAIVAPETVSAQSDLYALGAVGYFLLSAEPVFAADSVVEVCGHHLHSVPEPPSSRARRPISADLERVVLDCLAKDPGARPAGAEALRRRLAKCADAGTWSESDAAAWWQSHGPPDGRSSAALSTASRPVLRTMDVALDGRVDLRATSEVQRDSSAAEAPPHENPCARHEDSRR